MYSSLLPIDQLPSIYADRNRFLQNLGFYLHGSTETPQAHTLTQSELRTCRFLEDQGWPLQVVDEAKHNYALLPLFNLTFLDYKCRYAREIQFLSNKGLSIEILLEYILEGNFRRILKTNIVYIQSVELHFQTEKKLTDDLYLNYLRRNGTSRSEMQLMAEQGQLQACAKKHFDVDAQKYAKEIQLLNEDGRSEKEILNWVLKGKIQVLQVVMNQPDFKHLYKRTAIHKILNFIKKTSLYDVHTSLGACLFTKYFKEELRFIDLTGVDSAVIFQEHAGKIRKLFNQQLRKHTPYELLRNRFTPVEGFRDGFLQCGGATMYCDFELIQKLMITAFENHLKPDDANQFSFRDGSGVEHRFIVLEHSEMDTFDLVLREPQPEIIAETDTVVVERVHNLFGGTMALKRIKPGLTQNDRDNTVTQLKTACESLQIIKREITAPLAVPDSFSFVCSSELTGVISEEYEGTLLDFANNPGRWPCTKKNLLKEFNRILLVFVHFAERDWAHLDVNPSNIFIKCVNGELRLVLGDLEGMQSLASIWATRGLLACTEGYYSEKDTELLQQVGVTEDREEYRLPLKRDIIGLGISMWNVLTGRDWPPTDGNERADEIGAAFGESFENLISEMTEEGPANRPTALECFTRLQEVIGDQMLEAKLQEKVVTV